MDGITAYALSKKVATSAVSGVKSMSVDGQTLTINTKDSGVLTMTFPVPKNGVSVTDIDVNDKNQIVFTMSDGTEITSGVIPTVKGADGKPGKDGKAFTYDDFTEEQLEALKVKGDKGDPGKDAVSPTITENENNTDKIYKLDVTTADGTFTTPNLKGKDGSGSSTGEENVIESIKVNGVVQTVADDKSVDITVPTVDVNKNYVDTELTKKANVSDIPSLEGYVTDEELNAKGYLTSHQDISSKVDKVKGKSLIADTEIERLKSVKNYDDTEIKTELTKKANSTDVTKEISDKIAEVVSDAPESFNTLKEISDWISGHENDASAMNSAIKDNKTAITALQTGKADKNEIPTTVAELTDSADYAKKTDIPITLPADGGNSDTVNNHTVKSDVPENAVFTDTTYSDATQIEHGLMSVDDKKKLDGLKKYTPDGSTITADEDGTLHGVAKVTVDTALSPTSTNPVQNKVVKAYVDKKVSENVDFSTSTSKTLNDTVEAPLMIGKATRNLLNPTLQTTTTNGVTCTNNGDGTYTLNGTATAEAIFSIINNRSELYKRIVGKNILFLNGGHKWNSKYRILFNVSNSDYTKWGSEKYDGDSFVVPSGYENAVVDIRVNSGATVNNLVVKPMITLDLDATNDDFVPYSGYDIKTCGKNLLNPTLNTTQNNTTCTNNGDGTYTYGGITLTNNGDGTYTLKGTSLGDTWFFTNDIKVEKGTIYKFIVGYKNVSNKDLNIKIFKGGYSWNDLCKSNESFKSEYDYVKLGIGISKGVTLDNALIKIMLTTDLSATYDDFEPYQEGGTAHIDSSTEFPLLGLKSFDGETNIISPGNVEVTYAKSESGAAILDTSEKFVKDARKETTVNLLKPTLQTTTQNGVTCTNNGDGTYTLNGTATENVVLYIAGSPTKNTVGGYKLLGCPINGSKDTYRIVVSYYDDNESWQAEGTDIGNGVIIDGTYSRINYLIKVISGTTVTNLVFKPMITTNLNAAYDDFVPYTGDGETLASDVAEIKKDLGGLTFSASGTTLTITDGTNTWTLEANS